MLTLLLIFIPLLIIGSLTIHLSHTFLSSFLLSGRTPPCCPFFERNLIFILPFLVAVFFGYKLVQGMLDKEKKREEKRKRKEESKKGPTSKKVK